MSTEYEILQPSSSKDWDAYHEIRRISLFEERGRYGVYDTSHPDEFKEGNYPFLLDFKQVPVATVRIDLVDGGRAIMRLVAVHPRCRRRGHGRVLLQFAEDFARTHGCVQADSNAAVDALPFYKKLGYAEEAWDLKETQRDAVQVVKLLQLPDLTQ